MRILAFVKSEIPAVNTVRVVWPLKELSDLGYHTRIAGNEDVTTAMRDGKTDQFLGYDLYILGRTHGPRDGNPFEELRGSGKAPIIYDTDDDLLDDDRLFGYSDYVRQTCEMVDAITVSTEPLARKMERFGKPVYVIPNRLNIKFYREISLAAKRQIPQLTIGLVGTPTHWQDWQEVVEPLRAIARKYPDVRIVCGGYLPEYMKFIDGIIHIAPCHFSDYPAMLRQVDIRLSPLARTSFNECKSGIAALEAMASARNLPRGKLGGAVPICSKVPAYEGAVEHGVNGFLVDGPEGWQPILERLIEEADYRNTIAAQGFNWVRKQDVSRYARDRMAVYQTITRGM